MKLRQLISFCDVLPEHRELIVDHAIPLDGKPHATSLRWCSDADWRLDMVKANPGGVVIALPTTRSYLPGTVVLETLHPRMVFAAAMALLYPNHVPPRITTGKEVEVHPSASIGKDGFGFTTIGRMPHIGGATIGDRVTIGAHSCVDRGTLGDTIIGDDTHIDNLVHIAHNVRIGKRCQIVAGAMIGGSVELEDGVFVGINASIKNGVRIGAGAIIGMGAVVLQDVPAGATVVGNPARIIKQS